MPASLLPATRGENIMGALGDGDYMPGARLEGISTTLADGGDVIRQIPDEITGQIITLETEDLDLSVIWNNKAENQIPEDDAWAELWRVEKDGRGNYRYVLRFVRERVIRPGGKLTPAVERRLAWRRGKGRHQQSRDEADRLRGFAEHLAAGYQSGSTRRLSGQTASNRTRPRSVTTGRDRVRGVRGVGSRELPDVPTESREVN